MTDRVFERESDRWCGVRAGLGWPAGASGLSERLRTGMGGRGMSPKTIHVIMEISDGGDLLLTGCRRFVLSID